MKLSIIKPVAVLVPAGTRHNIINGSSGPTKLYTLCRDGVVHATKAKAEADDDRIGTRVSSSDGLPTLQQIPNFGQQFYLGCRLGGCGRLFLHQFVHPFDDQE